MQHQQGIWLSNCQCKYPAVVVHEVCPEQESHEEETHRELPSEADEKQMISLKLDPFTTTQAVAKELNVDHSMVLQHSEAKLERWKSLQCGRLMSWPKFFLKNCPFELLSSLMLYNSNAQFLDGIVTCSEKWNNELCIMSGVVQWLTWEDSPKHLPKPNLHLKKGHGHNSVIYRRSGSAQLLSPGGTIMYELCSANWWEIPQTAIPTAHTAQQREFSSSGQCPRTCHTTNASKIE